MSYMALYRKWRPQTFDEVVEQENVVNILRNAVIQNRIAHAYLFSGTRGTGKTTLAKIFARAVNCLHPVNGGPCNECEICRGILEGRILDVSEIDAASNNGVDNIRAVIDDSVYSSSVARYRVYIIDEVHMLSLAAFNALLKTLEEPPENVIFILATTEPNKLPVTVLSRCQRYEFKRISRDGIAARLRYICEETGIDATDEALGFLAEKADGALRDAISLLDQTSAASQGKITLASAREATGSLDREFLWDFTAAILNSDCRRLLELSRRIFNEGRDPSVFLRELIEVLRNMLVVMSVKDPTELIFEDEHGVATLRNLAKGLRVREVSMLIRELSGLDNNLKWAVSRQIVFEAGVLGAADRRWKEDTASIETRLAELEGRIADLAEKGIAVRAFVPETGALPADSAKVTAEPEITRSDAKESIAAVTEAKPAEPETAELKPSEPKAAETEAAEPETAKTKPSETKTAVTTPADIPASNQPLQAVRRLEKKRWDDIADEMEKRGQVSMLTWYSESIEQYELPGDRLLMVFEDDMTVSILQKSTPANLKVVNEAIASVLGRPMEQVVALKADAKGIIADAEKAAAASGTGADDAGVAETVPDNVPVNAPDAKKNEFDAGIKYFENLAQKMNFRIEYGD